MTDIKERLNKHYFTAVNKYGAEAVLGVFCYGSWNYNTAFEDSDVDTKCILIPNLWDLAIKPFAVKHLYVDDEVCECMTIMHMVDNWKKQNINFLEIMFTDYCIINPLYAQMWNECFPIEMREKVARYDLPTAIKSMSYQAIHTIKQNPDDLKKLMNTARIANTLANLVTHRDKSYKEIIWQNDTVGKIRTGETEVPERFVDDMITYFEEMIDRADEWEPFETDKCKVIHFLNDYIVDLIEYRINELD